MSGLRICWRRRLSAGDRKDRHWVEVGLRFRWRWSLEGEDRFDQETGSKWDICRLQDLIFVRGSYCRQKQKNMMSFISWTTLILMRPTVHAVTHNPPLCVGPHRRLCESSEVIVSLCRRSSEYRTWTSCRVSSAPLLVLTLLLQFIWPGCHGNKIPRASFPANLWLVIWCERQIYDWNQSPSQFSPLHFSRRAFSVGLGQRMKVMNRQ